MPRTPAASGWKTVANGDNTHMAKSPEPQKKSKRPSFKRESYRADETIFDEGDRGDYAYLVKEGRVEIRVGSRGDNPQVIAVLKKGDILGEMALLDDRPRMATAIAKEPTKLVAISKKEFSSRLTDLDPSMRRVITILVQRVRDVTEEFMRGKN